MFKMGLYNMLFGTNPQAPILMALLNLDQDNGEFTTGRFRDIYIDGEFIVLHTRNGGVNRVGCLDDGNDKQCTCCACCINNILPTHPNYHHDLDDEFDNTYNSCYFTIPDAAKDWENIWSSPRDKWDGLFKAMENKKDPTEDEKRAIEKGKEIMKKIMERV